MSTPSPRFENSIMLPSSHDGPIPIRRPDEIGSLPMLEGPAGVDREDKVLRKRFNKIFKSEYQTLLKEWNSWFDGLSDSERAHYRELLFGLTADQAKYLRELKATFQVLPGPLLDDIHQNPSRVTQYFAMDQKEYRETNAVDSLMQEKTETHGRGSKRDVCYRHAALSINIVSPVKHEFEYFCDALLDIINSERTAFSQRCAEYGRKKQGDRILNVLSSLLQEHSEEVRHHFDSIRGINSLLARRLNCPEGELVRDTVYYFTVLSKTHRGKVKKNLRELYHQLTMTDDNARAFQLVDEYDLANAA